MAEIIERAATPEDCEIVVKRLKSIDKRQPGQYEFSAGRVCNFGDALMFLQANIAQTDQFIALHCPSAVFVGQISLSPHNMTARIAKEIFWLSANGTMGGHMARRFVEWARACRCTHVSMSVQHIGDKTKEGRTGEFLKLLGMRPHRTEYTARLV